MYTLLLEIVVYVVGVYDTSREDMTSFALGDRVRVDIPDVTHPAYEEYHGRHGIVVQLLVHSMGMNRAKNHGEPSYRVQLDDGTIQDFGSPHLRPPIE